MKIYTIIALVTLIVILLFLFNKIYVIYNIISEDFAPKNYCDFNIETQDNSSKLDCIQNCNKVEGCFHYRCEDICGKCEQNKDTVCPWENDGGSNSKNGKPPAPNIYLETNSGQVKVSFKTARVKNYDIGGYLFYINKKGSSTEGIKEGINIGKLNNKNCIECEKVINNLDPKETYSISVRGYNKNGLGESSNIINFNPEGNLNTRGYKLLPNIKELEKDMTFCNN